MYELVNDHTRVKGLKVPKDCMRNTIKVCFGQRCLREYFYHEVSGSKISILWSQPPFGNKIFLSFYSYKGLL